MNVRSGGLMSRLLILITGFLLFFPLLNASDNTQDSEKKSWWQKRHDRPDIFYPHNAHLDVMQQEGDPCLLCHSFNRNKIVNPDHVKSLTTISNEPLEAICHDCHLDKHKAPFSCELCHTDPSAIWPSNHDFDYIKNHAEDARLDNGECSQCHLDLSFCTDCHFRRDTAKHQQHKLGYRNMHGIDARMNAYSCGRCHNASYCADCHRGGYR